MPDSTQISPKIAFLGYGACALAGCLWGTGFYWGRLAMNEMSVEHMVLYRFLFASLGMLPIVIAHRGRFHLSASETWTLLTAAAFGIPIQFLLQFHGLALTTVSHAALMVGAMPVLLAAAAALFANEKLDWIGWLALAGSSAGAALIVLGGARGRPEIQVHGAVPDGDALNDRGQLVELLLERRLELVGEQVGPGDVEQAHRHDGGTLFAQRPDDLVELVADPVE